MKEVFENSHEMEANNKVPLGYIIVFAAMIIWGIFYIYSYTPELGGWSQHKALVEEVEAK